MEIAEILKEYVLFSTIAVFVLGTIVGSFLNVWAFRYNTGKSIGGRSECLSCRRQLVWFELLPGVSFLLQKGRCRTCGSRLSLQYPFVEFLTGAIFAGLFLKVLSIPVFVYFGVIFCLYIVIGIYDVRHFIVPNGLAYGAALLAFLYLFIDFTTVSFVLPSGVDVLAGPLVALPLFLVWLLSRGMWMGLGDAKLLLSSGWILGLAGGFAALLLAFWAGAVFGVVALFYNRRVRRALLRAGKSKLHAHSLRSTMKSEIPFAPFLLFGFFCAFFFDLSIAHLILWSF